MNLFSDTNKQQEQNPNLTIWREELIKKTNFEEKLKKEVRFIVLIKDTR